jgi:hypothetical protein
MSNLECRTKPFVTAEGCGSVDMSWFFGRKKGTSATEVVPEPYNTNLCELFRLVARRDSIVVSCPVSPLSESLPGADDHGIS